MSGLRRWRRIAKGFIIFSVTWEAAVALVSLALFMFLAFRDGAAPSPDGLMPVIGTLGFSGIVILAIRDARGRGRRRHPDRVATAEEES